MTHKMETMGRYTYLFLMIISAIGCDGGSQDGSGQSLSGSVPVLESDENDGRFEMAEVELKSGVKFRLPAGAILTRGKGLLFNSGGLPSGMTLDVLVTSENKALLRLRGRAVRNRPADDKDIEVRFTRHALVAQDGSEASPEALSTWKFGLKFKEGYCTQEFVRTIVTEDGATKEFTFDNSLNSAQDELTTLTSTVYGNLTNQIKIIRKYDSYGEMVSSVKEEDYSANGTVNARTSETFSFDGGRLLERVYDLIIFSSAQEHKHDVETYVYDDRGNTLSGTLDKFEKNINVEIHDVKQKTYEYDVEGNKTLQIDWPSSTNGKLTNLFEYDDAGSLLTQEEIYGSATTGTLYAYEYDVFGNNLSISRDGSSANESVMTYDSKGRVVSRVRIMADKEIDSYDYDDAQTKMTHVYQNDSGNDGSINYGYKEVFTYAQNGDIVQEVRENDVKGNGMPEYRITKKYDNRGNLVDVLEESYSNGSFTLVKHTVNEYERICRD